MYGLLLESIYDSLISKYGEEVWEEIRQAANLEQHSFVTHEYYPEDVIPRLANAVSMVTGTRTGDVMNSFGLNFVTYITKYGYGMVLKVLGRHMRDFLNGLDNLHEYLRMSYPKMCAPSFSCENETKEGLTLRYRSKRRGFIHYVMGQIRQVGLMFYDTDVEIEIVSLEEGSYGTNVILMLHFDNKGFAERESFMKKKPDLDKFPIKSETFFQAFPFHVLFGRNMIIRNIGLGLRSMLKDAKGKKIDRVFKLLRPPISFIFQDMLDHPNAMYELQSREVTTKRKVERALTGYNSSLVEPENSGMSDNDRFDDHVHLKGQMRFIADWDAFVFLATPILANMDQMYEMDLYINDLSMHDVSRDLVMLGTERSKELKTALQQQKLKSRKLEEMMELLNRECKRSDTLLYQMIPREVADSLRHGEPSVGTCRTFDAVTVMFSQVERFTEISKQNKPLDIVSLLNKMYTKFDALTEKHKVYKVETIADSYMVVGGAPRETRNHAMYVSNMALEAIEQTKEIPNPSNTDEHIEIRIGVHSGTVVAGVVGLKMPRYCLFGDTVNTSSRMMTNGQAMKVHISESTRECLVDLPYEIEYRGTVQLKGKGVVNSYFLLSKKEGEIWSAVPNLSPYPISRSSNYGENKIGATPLEQIRQSHMSMRSILGSSEDDPMSSWTREDHLMVREGTRSPSNHGQHLTVPTDPNLKPRPSSLCAVS